MRALNPWFGSPLFRSDRPCGLFSTAIGTCRILSGWLKRITVAHQKRSCTVFATLDLWDFCWISVIVSLFAGGSAAYSLKKPTNAWRLRRIEDKLNLILKHLGLEYSDPALPGGLPDEVKVLADDPTKKILAIKLLREKTGIGLREAKDAIEAYMASRG
jgi:Ribosomal protein L7/L12 C-terminal domain